MPSITNPVEPSIPAPTYPFALPKLRFELAALEPHIDTATMELHYTKHHQAYIDKLNAALKDYPALHQLSVEDLMRHLSELPESIRQTVRNQGGGHANHQFFWKILKPGPASQPVGVLAEEIDKTFGSFDQFKDQFEQAALKLFGSGWTFLVIDPKANGALKIHTTANQDSVLLEGLPGLLACDVWEHAYYLQYRNRRADYLKAFWNLVDWEVVGHRLAGIRAGKKQL